uniref:Uncharacterized protein n=1 Tax=Chromera velia CCMP2878 TaxID=1169474 RepID=A0A0G4I2V2_9ALVE|eukprot:Cvel_10497.t1-p1 / transcript=Cvel_10497.t1 / gene=Cvel_10497 / organism=Chromera_velia_CCMP2878 / gene_product=hypothetical protein / transcript_product=hypothetical protein / location=Cvel_scaffold634:58251-61584(-) / protein_length=769 / sequence_SO=supercontig / SO=protein_coding / is_pseudo=false
MRFSQWCRKRLGLPRPSDATWDSLEFFEFPFEEIRFLINRQERRCLTSGSNCTTGEWSSYSPAAPRVGEEAVRKFCRNSWLKVQRDWLQALRESGRLKETEQRRPKPSNAFWPFVHDQKRRHHHVLFNSKIFPVQPALPLRNSGVVNELNLLITLWFDFSIPPDLIRAANSQLNSNPDLPPEFPANLYEYVVYVTNHSIAVESSEIGTRSHGGRGEALGEYEGSVGEQSSQAGECEWGEGEGGVADDCSIPSHGGQMQREESVPSLSSSSWESGESEALSEASEGKEKEGKGGGEEEGGQIEERRAALTEREMEVAEELQIEIAEGRIGGESGQGLPRGPQSPPATIFPVQPALPLRNSGVVNELNLLITLWFDFSIPPDLIRAANSQLNSNPDLPPEFPANLYEYVVYVTNHSIAVESSEIGTRSHGGRGEALGEYEGSVGEQSSQAGECEWGEGEGGVADDCSIPSHGGQMQREESVPSLSSSSWESGESEALSEASEGKEKEGKGGGEEEGGQIEERRAALTEREMEVAEELQIEIAEGRIGGESGQGLPRGPQSPPATPPRRTAPPEDSNKTTVNKDRSMKSSNSTGSTESNSGPQVPPPPAPSTAPNWWSSGLATITGLLQSLPFPTQITSSSNSSINREGRSQKDLTQTGPPWQELQGPSRPPAVSRAAPESPPTREKEADDSPPPPDPDDNSIRKEMEAVQKKGEQAGVKEKTVILSLLRFVGEQAAAPQDDREVMDPESDADTKETRSAADTHVLTSSSKW